MMLPLAMSTPYRLVPAFHLPASLGRLGSHVAPAALEFAAFVGFLAMCIGLMAEFS